jgi:hypothetical protein
MVTTGDHQSAQDPRHKRRMRTYAAKLKPLVEKLLGSQAP